LEPTNAPYAIAKIAGLTMCQAYRRQHGFDAVVAMPTNLYGPGDNFHPTNSHVIPGLIRRFAEAKESRVSEVMVWGTGRPLREFLYVDDLADALVFLMRSYSDEKPVNVGSGEEYAISDLVRMIARVVGFGGDIRFDSTMPDGTPRKALDSSRLRDLGWRPTTTLEEGLALTYRSWLTNPARASHPT